ncbi:MAG TPA: diguanylate cyclase [Thermomicrobiaceae bacterium]|nr:diguanylate cyclase [Thermomicrobiaceae bacterium]
MPSGQFLRALLEGEEIQQILHDAVEAAARSLGADGAEIRLSADFLTSESQRSFSSGAPAAARDSAALDEFIPATRVTTFLDPSLIDDDGAEHPFRLVMPIRHREQVLGHLCLHRASRDPFTDDDAAAAREICTVLAVALEHVRLLQIERWQRDTLGTVHNLARRLNHAATYQAIAEIAVEECAAAFGCGKAALHRYEPHHGMLVMAAALGLPLPLVTALGHLTLESGPFGRAARQHGLVIADNLLEDETLEVLRELPESARLGLTAWGLPLLDEKDALLGVITIFPPARRNPDDTENKLLHLLAHQIAVAMDRARLAERGHELYRATVASLAAAVDAKDPFTHNHSWQVAAYSRTIAEAMTLPPAEVEIIELAGLLHDVGKIGIPDRVLQKNDQLDPDEWAMMRRHPELGAKILGDNPALATLLPLVRHHHERYDGHGYPDQLAGDEIPLGAAIVGLADAFDTMTSDRPYRRSRDLSEAVAEVEHGSGTHFHPQVVAAFLAAVRSGTISVTPEARRGTTRELRLKRVVGAEARAFGLLQRISAEVSTLVEIDRFLLRLNELISAEFPDSRCNVFVAQAESNNLVAIHDTVDEPAPRQTLVCVAGEGIVGWVAQHGVPQNVRDVLEDARFRVTSHRLIRAELAVPLLVEARCVGVIDLQHPEPGAFSPSDQQVLEMVATYVAQAIEVADLHHRIKQQAELDPLTGLLNHRAFYRELDEAVEQARSASAQLALAILDLDNLKQINDTAGHLAGDSVIRRIAEILRVRTRPEDTVARYGGDEFAVIMPRASRAVMEARLRLVDEAIQARQRDQPLSTVSWGIACYPHDGTRPAELVARADAAMYQVKSNRVSRRRPPTSST